MKTVVFTRPIYFFALGIHFLLASPGQAQATPCFMTHHAPMGAWSSFTFGQPGMGLSMDHEQLKLEATADLLVAISRGPGAVQMLPFITGLKTEDYEGKVAGWSQSKAFRGWKVIAPDQLHRKLTPGLDEFSGGDLTLRVYSPRPDLTDPDAAHSNNAVPCPALLLEVEIDNTHYYPRCVTLSPLLGGGAARAKFGGDQK